MSILKALWQNLEAIRVDFKYSQDLNQVVVAKEMNHLKVLLAGLAFVITQFSSAAKMSLTNASSDLQFFEPSRRVASLAHENNVPRYLLELYRLKHHPSRKNNRITVTAFFLDGRLVKILFPHNAQYTF